MYFLLNDTVLNLQGDDLAPAVLARRFGSVGFDYVQTLGKELFAAAVRMLRELRARRIAHDRCGACHLVADAIEHAPINTCNR